MFVGAVVVVVILFFAVSYAQQPGPDEGPLLDLADATDYTSWFQNAGWNTANSYCTWYGLDCDATPSPNSKVIRIDLLDNNLNGRLPSSIAQLDGLTYLRLGNNNLQGTIPASIQGLTRLVELQMYNDRFTGPLPVALTTLTSLEILNLRSNILTSIPEDWSIVVNLKQLIIHSNNINATLPSSLSSLPLLSTIHIHTNQFYGAFPPSWKAFFFQAQSLDISNNKIDGYLPEINGISSLTYFNVENNLIAGYFPSFLRNAPYLNETNSLVGANSWYCPIPSWSSTSSSSPCVHASINKLSSLSVNVGDWLYVNGENIGYNDEDNLLVSALLIDEIGKSTAADVTVLVDHTFIVVHIPKELPDLAYKNSMDYRVVIVMHVPYIEGVAFETEIGYPITISDSSSSLTGVSVGIVTFFVIGVVFLVTITTEKFLLSGVTY